MNPMIPNAMVAFITGSLCCALIGGAMIAVRISRLIRNERRSTFRIQAASRLAVEELKKCNSNENIAAKSN